MKGVLKSAALTCKGEDMNATERTRVLSERACLRHSSGGSMP